MRKDKGSARANKKEQEEAFRQHRKVSWPFDLVERLEAAYKEGSFRLNRKHRHGKGSVCIYKYNPRGQIWGTEFGDPESISSTLLS